MFKSRSRNWRSNWDNADAQLMTTEYMVGFFFFQYTILSKFVPRIPAICWSCMRMGIPIVYFFV